MTTTTMELLSPHDQARLKREAIEHVQASYEHQRDEQRREAQEARVAATKRERRIGFTLIGLAAALVLAAITCFNLAVYWAGQPNHAHDVAAQVFALNGVVTAILAIPAAISGGLTLDNA